MKEAFSMPLQGWDAVRILTQIASFQTLHYLLLATLLPPFLAIFADTSSLMFEGGPTQVGMVFDWRQVAGKPTYDWQLPQGAKMGPQGWVEVFQDANTPTKGSQEAGKTVVDPAVLASWNLDNVWLDQGSTPQEKVLDHEQILRFKHHKNNNTDSPTSPAESKSAELSPSGSKSVEEALEHWEWSHTADSRRSYVLILTWLLTAPFDILLLVYLVRRPTHMLDHALTFHLVNLLVCSWYSGAVPRGLKWWLTMLVHAAVVIVWSEQLAIKREMGRGVGYNLVGSGDDEEARDVGKKEVLFDAEGERIELRPL